MGLRDIYLDLVGEGDVEVYQILVLQDVDDVRDDVLVVFGSRDAVHEEARRASRRWCAKANQVELGHVLVETGDLLVYKVRTIQGSRWSDTGTRTTESISFTLR
jgi:hypothetical protein